MPEPVVDEVRLLGVDAGATYTTGVAGSMLGVGQRVRTAAARGEIPSGFDDHNKVVVLGADLTAWYRGLVARRHAAWVKATPAVVRAAQARVEAS